MFKIPPNPYRRQQIILGLLSLICLMGVLFYVPPLFIADVMWVMSYLPLLGLISLSLFWFHLSIWGKWKQSGFIAIISGVFVWLRINQLDSVINLVLLGSFFLIVEWYWKLEKPKDESGDLIN